MIKKSLSEIHFDFRWAESLSVFAQQKNLNLIWTPAYSSNFCAQISETAQRKHSAIPLSES